MDIAEIPMADFLKFCKEGAKTNGYYWIVCILSRTRDSQRLYDSIKEDWQSLDSLTGNRVLVLLAGNEICTHKESSEEYRDHNSCVTDKRKRNIKRYNSFATIIGNQKGLKADLSSVRYEILQKAIINVEKTQTDAVNSLRDYLKIEEKNIPCLVYIPLFESKFKGENIVVPLPKGRVDLYAYFKTVMGAIAQIHEQIIPTGDKPIRQIKETYKKLIALVEKSDEREDILEHIKTKTYYKCAQPIRGLLSKYIDLCRDFYNREGKVYNPDKMSNEELFVKIKEILQTTELLVRKENSGMNITNYGNWTQYGDIVGEDKIINGISSDEWNKFKESVNSVSKEEIAALIDVLKEINASQNDLTTEYAYMASMERNAQKSGVLKKLQERITLTNGGITLFKNVGEILSKFPEAIEPITGFLGTL